MLLVTLTLVSTHISLFVLTGSALHNNVYAFTQLCTNERRCRSLVTHSVHELPNCSTLPHASLVVSSRSPSRPHLLHVNSYSSLTLLVRHSSRVLRLSFIFGIALSRISFSLSAFAKCSFIASWIRGWCFRPRLTSSQHRSESFNYFAAHVHFGS